LIFSSPLFVSGLFASGIDVADRFILDFFFGKKQVGEYGFAYRIAMITNIFVISFRTAWIPFALNRYQEGNYQEHFGKTLLKLLTAGIFILLTVSFFAEDLFRIKLDGKFLFNPEYKNGLMILPYVVLGYIFSSLASFYSVYPFVSNKSYHFLISDGIGLVSNLILNFILIPSIGLIGAGISTCISFMFIAGYLYLIARGKIEIHYQKRGIFISSSVGILLLIIGTYFNNTILQIILVIIFLFIAEFVVKIKLSKLYKLVQ
jgi:O-antigen/teichoic acid export membrane protein